MRPFSDAATTKLRSSRNTPQGLRSQASGGYDELRRQYWDWLRVYYGIQPMDYLSTSQGTSHRTPGLTDMANYRYTPARRVDDEDSYAPVQPAYGNTISPETNAYVDDSYGKAEDSAASNAMFYDPASPFFGMDPQLAGFVQKHNVVMGDGAVLNITAMKEKAAMEGKPKKKFTPPFGLTLCQFIFMVIGILLGIAILIIALVVGLVYGLRLVRPSYPHATPWWRRAQMYQLNVATWANDFDGPVGRLEDVIPRMTYLSVQIGATSAILTDLLASDSHGITNWTAVSNQVAAPDEAMSQLIPRLVSQAKQPRGPIQKANPINLLLGMPLYATSAKHSWFQQSKLSVVSKFTYYYIWQSTPPASPQEHRYFAYDAVRMAYYRHVHGNPNVPLLNLTNPDVQTEMKKVIEFWRAKLNIMGVLITNSTNVIPDMIPPLRSILNGQTDENFVWFADNPAADAKINTGSKVCFFTLQIRRRVPTRTNDITDQIMQAMADPRLGTCSPIWRVDQMSEDNKDFLTIQELAYFLPGSYLMMAGQEVDLSNGETDLMAWSYKSFNDFSTYCPANIMLPNNGMNRLQSWRAYWTAASGVGLLSTAIDQGRVVIFPPSLTDNLLNIYRKHRESNVRAYFVVSFQTLNTVVQFSSSVFFDIKSPQVEVAYDSKQVYHGRRQFGSTTLFNNQVLLLYYY
ncbi:hypothetical protein X801_04427 [Opisthorchis viverrini]|uniref:Glycosyl hydrolase family 13 catalytic domain-containing protein n=2 Tax=Opisthorchis viverrini TaxID=6198 RepID=A0A1S8WZP2_OPIVI|nr:hypothetical protein X801_04427 [Opisthorchis viverrini]